MTRRAAAPLALALCALGAAHPALSQVREMGAGKVYLGTVRASDMHGLSYATRGCIVALSEEARQSQAATAGQELVRLDDRDALLSLRSAEARVQDLQAAVAERQLAVDAARADDVRRRKELDFVSKEFDRNNTLFGRGIINETALEAVERRIMDATFAAERAKEAIVTAESARNRAEIALEIGRLDLQAAERVLEELRLLAPFDGVLVGFEENVGDCVQEGELAARLYAPAAKAVDIYVLISDLAASDGSGVAVGGAVTIQRASGTTCDGAITRIDTEADLESQFVQASIAVDGTCAPGLFLNEAVQVALKPEAG
ncbi:HlyD family efflux transporter periplasmic adaptor subunit [Thetidibacter halocola]|uniref:HlyD family efflux transporter periplasmic adaptor subunit n=1 Tax=Thetidibacter halocola TaxID=2827239 RepID=A0A8J8B7Y2_9RHOB|nr:HlyD family secretion protein [Thetidibacter halocola]MBS0125611.1 HlyD family efflux transporter periplasmic adaptor subunit [Thetidibacter halocola]